MAVDAGTRTGCTTATTATTCLNSTQARTVFVLDGPSGVDMVRIKFGRSTTTSPIRVQVESRLANGTYATSGWRNLPNSASYTVNMDWTKSNGRVTVTFNGGSTITVNGGQTTASPTAVFVGLIDGAAGSGAASDLGRLRFDVFYLA